MKKLILLAVFALISASLFSAQSSSEKKYLKDGAAFYSQKLFAKAAESFSKAVELNPKNANAAVYAGYSYLAIKDRANALKYLKKAYAISKNAKLYAYIHNLESAPQNRAAAAGKSNMYEGGVARMYAMGNPSISVPDITSIVDLYSEGFTSFYAFRDRRDFVNVEPSLSFPSGSSVQSGALAQYSKNSSTVPALNFLQESENGVTRWLSPDGVLIIRPYFSMAPGSVKTGDALGNTTQTNSSAYNYAFEAEYAHRIMPNLSAGISLGYATLNSGMSSADSSEKTDINTSKIEYLFSGTYLMPVKENNLYFGLSLGNKTGLLSGLDISLPSSLSTIQPFLQAAGGIYNLFNTITLVDTQDTPASKTIDTMKVDISAFDIALASGFVMPGKLDADISLRLAPGIGAKLSGTNSYTDKTTNQTTVSDSFEAYDTAKNGLEAVVSAKARGYIGAFTPSIKLGYTSLGLDFLKFANDTNPEKIHIGIFDATFGASLKISKFIIPLELSFQNGSYTQAGDYPAVFNIGGWKVLLGAEYVVSDSLKARLGFDYSAGSITIAMNGAAPVASGTADNPATNATGLNIGMGYSKDKFEGNIALRYLINGVSPMPTGYASMSSGDVYIIMDFKYYL